MQGAASYAYYFGGYFITHKFPRGDGFYTGGAIFTINLCTTSTMSIIGGTFALFKWIFEAQVAGKMAYDVIDHKSEVQINPNGTVISRENIKGEIVFKDVSFRYPTRKDVEVLKNFSCVFEAGKTTALVGPSGSGKSTIIQMIERFYNPAGGSVSVDGHPIDSLDLRAFR